MVAGCSCLESNRTEKENKREKKGGKGREEKLGFLNFEEGIIGLEQ